MKKSPIRTVRTFCTSNVAADEDTKTLWVFGAGASRHLAFPLSGDFFEKSIGLCTQHMKDFPNTKDIGYQFFRDHFRGKGLPVPRPKQIAAFKLDAELALRFLHTWTYLAPEHNIMARLQFLYRRWQELPGLLAEIGLSSTPADILEKYPEELIQAVREVKPKTLVTERGSYDLNTARRKLDTILLALQEIYFFTLSHFNDAARSDPPSQDLYEQLVRSFILEKNARIITFNYDTMLDEAIFHRFTRTWHYGGMTIAGINGYPVSKGETGDLIVIKPHGSLHFLICPTCKRAYVNWFWTYRRTGANSLASDNRRCAVCRKPQPGRKEMLSSLMVAPLYDKKIIKQSHQAISHSFAWCDHVVSVGYSFPEQDTYFFDCIAKGVRRRRGTPITIRIVSHTPDSARQIKSRLDREMAKRGFAKTEVKVRATKLNGFEEVQSGFENLPVKT